MAAPEPPSHPKQRRDMRSRFAEHQTKKKAPLQFLQCSRSLIVFVLGFFSLLFVFSQNQSYISNAIIPQEDEVVVDDVDQAGRTESLSANSTCHPMKNIVFLKTHKCASSTIQNIFMRFGYRNNLTFVLPLKGNYIGHPQLFNWSLVPDARKFGRHYNILAHHCRFNYHEMRRLLPKNTVFVTILRNPVDLFESMFSFYSLHRFYRERFETLGKRHEPSFYERRMGRKLGFNQMLFDLGFDQRFFTNTSAVTEYVHFLDSAFDLVLLSERMDESLVLLRNLLRWDIDDVIAFKLNARNKKFKKKLSAELTSRLSHFNSADIVLYRYFTGKFNKRVQEFGKERMADEVQALRNRTLLWYDICVQKQDFQVKVINSKKYYTNRMVMAYVKKRDFLNETCDELTAQEPVFTEKLYFRQRFMFPKSTFIRSRKMSARYRFKMHQWPASK